MKRLTRWLMLLVAGTACGGGCNLGPILDRIAPQPPERDCITVTIDGEVYEACL